MTEEVKEMVRRKVQAICTLHELVCREDKHRIPRAPDGFYWECVSYSGDEYQISYFKLRCERCGVEFDEPRVMCKWPPREDPEWIIPAPEHECGR